MKEKSSLKQLSEYIKKNRGIESLLGHIHINSSDILGQGGNGIVYSGKINNNEIAIKFLLNYTSKKIERFRAEYLNVNMVKEQLINVVNCLHYGVLIVDDTEFPYILMNKYKQSLKTYRKELEDLKWENVSKLFESLCSALESLEGCDIIHRDLKPENILIDNEGEFIITDFGIASFNSEAFPINNLTKKEERLANFEFCAPEQLKSSEVTSATDIYSFAQIIYWFVFREVNRGTGGDRLYNVFKNVEASYLDNIIYQCLSNNPDERYQSIKEIKDKLNEFKMHSKEIDPFEDMRLLSQIVRSTVPEFFQNVYSTDDKQEIKSLLSKIHAATPNRLFEYNTGTSNNQITSIKSLDNGNYLLNYREVNIVKIWGLLNNSVYNDVIVLDTKPVNPYVIDNKEYTGIAIINGELVVPVEKIESGYIRYKGEVMPINQLDIEERYIYDDSDRYFAIGAFHQCTIILENDKYISKLQEINNLDNDIIIELQKQISKNKKIDVRMRI